MASHVEDDVDNACSNLIAAAAQQTERREGFRFVDSGYVEPDFSVSIEGPEGFPTPSPCPGDRNQTLLTLLKMIPVKARKRVEKMAKMLGLPKLSKVSTLPETSPAVMKLKTVDSPLIRGGPRAIDTMRSLAPPSDVGLWSELRSQWNHFCSTGWQVALKGGIISAATAFATTVLQSFLDHFFEGYPRVQSAIKIAFKAIGWLGLIAFVALTIAAIYSGVGIVPLIAGIICSIIGAALGTLAAKAVIWLCKRYLPDHFKEACKFETLVRLFCKKPDEELDSEEDIPEAQAPLDPPLMRDLHTCGDKFGPYLQTGACTNLECNNVASVALEHDTADSISHFLYCQDCWESTHKHMLSRELLMKCNCGAPLSGKFVALSCSSGKFSKCENSQCIKVGICVTCENYNPQNEQKPRDTAIWNPRTLKWAVQTCAEHVPTTLSPDQKITSLRHFPPQVLVSEEQPDIIVHSESEPE